MTQKEITEGSKLICVFMGGYVDGDDFYIGEDSNPYPDEVKYSTSWNWLIPVVEKITEIDITPAPNWTGYRVEIVPRGYVKISGFPMETIFTNVSVEGSLIMATFKAVIQFIKWHNQSKKS